MIRSERGQSAAEYMGVLLLVAVIIGALISAGVGGQIAKAMNASVCKIADGACEAVGIGDGPKVTSERASGRPPAADRDGDGVSNQRERRARHRSREHRHGRRRPARRRGAAGGRRPEPRRLRR